jgi:hypothetical protein
MSSEERTAPTSSVGMGLTFWPDWRQRLPQRWRRPGRGERRRRSRHSAGGPGDGASDDLTGLGLTRSRVAPAMSHRCDDGDPDDASGFVGDTSDTC